MFSNNPSAVEDQRLGGVSSPLGRHPELESHFILSGGIKLVFIVFLIFPRVLVCVVRLSIM
jgi:hypothetical protein